MICQYRLNIGQFFHEGMSRLEHFPKFNKHGVWNKNVLGGKFSKIISAEGTSVVAHRCQSKKTKPFPLEIVELIEKLEEIKKNIRTRGYGTLRFGVTEL